MIFPSSLRKGTIRVISGCPLNVVMAMSESSHYHTNTSLRSSANCATPQLQNSTQSTVACNILTCLSTSISLDCFCSSTTQENNTIRDHHNGEAEASCQRPALSALKRDPRSIFAPPYPCLSLVYLFFCLFVTISLVLRSVSCFLRASRVSRLL